MAAVTLGQSLLNWLKSPFGGSSNLNYFKEFFKAASGDLVVKCLPATATVSKGTGGVTGTTIIKAALTDALGNIHQWFNGPLTLAVTQSTSGGGTGSISPTAGSQTASDGYIAVTVQGSAGTWSAGTLQVGTLTVSSAVVNSGTVSVVVTAAGLTGSPKTYTVAAALWAVMSADSVLKAMFAVTNVGATIVLTDLPPAGANDGTMNMALNLGTASGVSGAYVATTAGVAADSITVTVTSAITILGYTVATTGNTCVVSCV